MLNLNLEAVYIEASSANRLVSQRLACLGGPEHILRTEVAPVWSLGGTPQVILPVVETEFSNRTNCILSVK